MTARELAIDFVWDGLFAPRAISVSGSDLTVRLDLTGKRSVLGDLETAVTNFTKPTDKAPPPNPRLRLENLKVIADTLSGPLVANGKVSAQDASAFVIDLTAKPAELGLSGATVELNAAALKATVTGQDINAALNLDLATFTAAGATLSDVRIEAELAQSAGRMKGQGTAALGDMKTNDVALANADAEISLQAAAFGGGSLSDWLSNVSHLRIDGKAGAGTFAHASWKSAMLNAQVQPVADRKSGGDVVLVVNDLRSTNFAAGEAKLTGKINIAAGDIATAEGTIAIKSGLVPAQQRAAMVNTVGSALESVLPPFASVLRGSINRAAQAFDANLLWSAASNADGLTASLKSGSAIKAASGLTLTATSAAPDRPFGSYATGTAGWSAAGDVTMQGGGGPTIVLDVDGASGANGKIEAAGAAYLRSWKVGSDVVAADLTGLQLATEGPKGAAAGSLRLLVDGGLAGGVWKAAQAQGQVKAKWDETTFFADAPDGALLQWKEARYGDAVFGASALHYSTIGHVAERLGSGLVGRGQLAPVSIPMKGNGFTAAVNLGATRVAWRADSTVRGSFDMAPASVDLVLDDRAIPIRIGDMSGDVSLASGWKVNGAFRGAGAEMAEGNVSDLQGKFDLAGAGGALSGGVSGISMRLIDPLQGDGRRYEDLNFRGEGHLKDSSVDFIGTFTLAKSGVQVAHVTGRHSLEANAGDLVFDPTPLVFRPRQLQPSDLSPLLVGPANVTGRVDAGGHASWSADGFKASGVIDLKDLDFTLASAGVFEGVSGRIEVADLINMKSAPGQKITLDKVTLGLPIEKGEIGFTLVGYDRIRLESAQWPFGGGFIRIDPQVFTFSSEAQNRVVARAVDWDLAKLVDQFNLPDMKLQGVVGGEFPVMFTTGSAVIDHATLKSVKPGVIQYSGSTGDAAAEADSNSKMLFDALKDFHYEVLQVGLDGNLTGKMMLTFSILGRNPDVLSGQPFQLNIGVDSALVPLLTTTLQRPDIRTVIEQSREPQK